jgi:DNA-binding NarL/FixJ family response regulator
MTTATPHRVNATRTPSMVPIRGKRIYLVDSQPLVRDWLKRLLTKELNAVICGEAETASSALRGIASCDPHLAIIDLFLEDGSGFDLIGRISAQSPRTTILVLSAHNEAYYAQHVLRSGAKGYISKRQPITQILTAVRQVLQGKIYVSAQCAQFLMRSITGLSSAGRSNSPVGSLSEREMEVFSMIGQGHGPRRIGGSLHISPRTVQTYCVRIKEKLQLRDASELHREAILWMEAIVRRHLASSRPDRLLGIGATG